MMTLYSQPYCQPCKTVKEKLRGMEADFVIVDDLLEFPDTLRSVPTLNHGNLLISGLANILDYLSTLENQ